MQSVNNPSSDTQKEKQTIINSLWESLFGGDVKKPPDKKLDINSNRRLYMLGLEDFSLDSRQNKIENLADNTKINDEGNRKHAIQRSRDPKKDLRHVKSPPKTKDVERKQRLKDEHINNKEDKKKMKQFLPEGSIPITSKNKEALKKEKMRNHGKEVKNKDTDKFLGRVMNMNKNSKLSFNLNNLPEDAKEKSEIIAHVIERVDSLKKKMQYEKEKLDNKSKEQTKRNRTIRSISVGKTDESPSVKTIYWPENRENTSGYPVLCQFDNFNHSEPKIKKLEKLPQTSNKNPESFGEVDEKDNKDQENFEKVDRNQLKSIEESRINNKVNKEKNGTEVNLVRELENVTPAPTDLKHKGIHTIKPHEASDTSIHSSTVENNQSEEPGLLVTNDLTRIINDIKCDDGNVNKSDRINEDENQQILKENEKSPKVEKPSKDLDLKKLDFGVFNVEIKNDDISSMFIMESNLDKDHLGKKEIPNHFLAGDGSGERGFIKSSCKVESPRNDVYYEAKHNGPTELVQNNATIATSYLENSKSKLIQSFMESQKTAISDSSPPHINNNNRLNFEANITDYDESPREKDLTLQNCNDFYKQDNENYFSSVSENEFRDNSVGHIYKLRSYIPASQRKVELRAKYVPKLVSFCFYTQVATCYEIAAQFDKLLTCETFSKQENNILKKRVVQFAEDPKFENFDTMWSDSNLSENEEIILDINYDCLLATKCELESVSDTLEENQEILEEIETREENYCFSGEDQFSILENNKIESPDNNSLPTAISNPIYVVIMDANEKNTSSFGKAEICKIESSRFSEIILNEISGVKNRSVVEVELPKSDKYNKERKPKSIFIDKPKKERLVPSQSEEKIKEKLFQPTQSRDKIKTRASSVCLPSGVKKYHTKRNQNSPKIKSSQSNVVIDRSKMNTNAVVVSKQCRNLTKNEVPPKSRLFKDKRSSSLEPTPENLNVQIMLSIKDEIIRELKNMNVGR